MPAFVLGAALAAVLMRQTRNSMIEVLSTDYIRYRVQQGARGAGGRLPPCAPERTHSRRDDPGAPDGRADGRGRVTEQIFVVPGFGRLIVEAVFTRDYPLVQGVVLITASACY